MPLPDSAYTQFTDDLTINRLLNGMWQVSGGHGSINPKDALKNMLDYHTAGFTTWDLADHYGPAEDFIGQFRKLLAQTQGEQALANIQAFTKWVPRPSAMSRQTVESAIDTSLRRMNVEALDLLQFHWWDYSHPAYLDAMGHMHDLQRAGKIKHLALTNFDTEHTLNILNAGIRLVSNQVQYSIIDRRPQVKMIDTFTQHKMTFLAYGTLAGGLLTDRYLNQPEPPRQALKTASLRKYKNMVDVWGGWALFQELLVVLRGIADKHSVTIANVAVRYVLQQPQVAGVIVGARLGISDNRDDNARVFTFALDNDDISRIDAISAQSNDLFAIIGDCGDEYR
ncbi:MAG: aldo/keto reductase [Chloroflexota bacterium]